jgi:hypothetical protein
MPALVAGIHVFDRMNENKTWMAGTSLAMTRGGWLRASIGRMIEAFFRGTDVSSHPRPA